MLENSVFAVDQYRKLALPSQLILVTRVFPQFREFAYFTFSFYWCSPRFLTAVVTSLIFGFTKLNKKLENNG